MTMLVLRHHNDVPAAARGSVVAIGNFDGVHRGHQAVIAKAGELARRIGAPLAVLTFEPHPRRFFAPELPPFRLTTFRLKARLIEALGVDCLFVLAFDADLAAMSAEGFAKEVLADGFQVRHVVVGDNFAFGHKRAGNVALLQEFGREMGFGVDAMARVSGAGDAAKPFSSTLVRDYIAAGNPTRAALLLGRYWEIEGRVLPGEQRGRQLGFPTANIDLGDILRPRYGVYAVRAGLDCGAKTRWLRGVANLGVRPTVDGRRELLEVHLFDFAEDIYGQHLRVALIDFLRPEMKFDGLEALRAQIAEDTRRARETLSWEDFEADWPASAMMTGPS